MWRWRITAMRKLKIHSAFCIVMGCGVCVCVLCVCESARSLHSILCVSVYASQFKFEHVSRKILNDFGAAAFDAIAMCWCIPHVGLLNSCVKLFFLLAKIWNAGRERNAHPRTHPRDYSKDFVQPPMLPFSVFPHSHFLGYALFFYRIFIHARSIETPTVSERTNKSNNRCTAMCGTVNVCF